MHIIIKIPKQICLKPYYVSVGRCWGERGGGGQEPVLLPCQGEGVNGEGGGEGQVGLEVNPNARYSSNTAARSQQGLHGQFSKIILLEKKLDHKSQCENFIDMDLIRVEISFHGNNITDSYLSNCFKQIYLKNNGNDCSKFYWHLCKLATFMKFGQFVGH